MDIICHIQSIEALQNERRVGLKNRVKKIGRTGIRLTEKDREGEEYWKMKDGKSTAATERTSIKTST